MTDNLKIDIINGSYSKMRISGITVQPSPEDTVVALRRLESFANRLRVRNVCTGYNFEDSPDPNSSSGLDSSLWDAFEWVLAERLLSDFGKGQQPDAILLRESSGSLSFLYSVTANPTETEYPSRQPIGSGNAIRGNRFREYYYPTAEAPNTCATNRMIVGDVSDFVEHFDSYLVDSETLASFTIEADTGLTISSSSLSSPDVSYRVTAVGNNGTKSDSLLRVKIVATTSLSRVETRIINFELTTAPEIS